MKTIGLVNTIKQTLRVLVGMVVVVSLTTVPAALGASKQCDRLPTENQLQQSLQAAALGIGISAELGPGTGVGGFFGGVNMWGAVVNADGVLCEFITSTEDPRDVLPLAQAAAKAKAYTANSVSTDAGGSSTARLYTITQPGHSLFGMSDSNPFNPKFLAPPNGSGGGKKKITGGIITFGGGVPLYNAQGEIVGGLGVGGDTACADHEIAKRVRDLAGLNPPGGPLVDDIIYTEVDGPNIMAHPVCTNTFRNGVDLGLNEEP